MIGSFTETDDDTVLKAYRLIYDYIEQTLRRNNYASFSTRKLIYGSLFYPDLSDVPARKRVGRKIRNEIISTKSADMRSTDVILASISKNIDLHMPSFDYD